MKHLLHAFFPEIFLGRFPEVQLTYRAGIVPGTLKGILGSWKCWVVPTPIPRKEVWETLEARAGVLHFRQYKEVQDLKECKCLGSSLFLPL